jgi:hypothetical protein
MYDTIDQMAALNRAAGHNWFNHDTLEWFGCKIESSVLHGRYFISSEQDQHGAWGGERRYTIRMVDDRGVVHSLGQFGEYTNLVEAAHELTMKLDGVMP